MRCKTDFFNVRLYWEGLKRLRVLGFGVAFLSMTVSAMIPAVYLIEDLTHVYQYEWEPTVRTLQENGYCIPLAFLPWLMPIFVLVMFSFLFKRRESDFYHSIPYTRTCVYTTYTAAVLTCVWVITALCALVSGIFWAVNPYVIFSVGTLVRWTVASGLASTLLCAIMLLAVSLCGNLATTLLNFLVFSTLPRIVCFLIASLLENGPGGSLIDVYSFLGGFLTLKYFLPLAFLEYTVFSFKAGPNFCDTPVYIYTAVVSLLILIVAGFCYRRRRSETAGNSAPSGKMQHAFRIIFSLPFALIATAMCVEGDVILTGIMIVVFLLIYYLYELITTKQIKRLWKVTPYLGAVLACCLVFLGFCQAIRLGVLYWEIDAEDIEAVELVYPCYGLDGNIHSFHLEDNSMFPLKSDDPILIGAVSDMLKNTQKVQRKYSDYIGRGKDVKIYLKSGLVITRFVFEENDDLRDWIADRYPVFREGLLEFPSYDEVKDVSMWEVFYEESVGQIRNERTLFYSEMELQMEFVGLLQKEYLLLNDEERYAVKFDSQMEQKTDVILITLRCQKETRGMENFSLYISSEYLPQTHAWLSNYLQIRNVGKTVSD